MDLEKADSLVSFRQLATLVDRVSFTTDYLLARLPSLLHHTVRDAVTGEACSPITLSDYSAHLHPKMGAGHGSAFSSSSDQAAAPPAPATLQLLGNLPSAIKSSQVPTLHTNTK